MSGEAKKEPGIIRSSLTLFIITALAAFALAFVYTRTKDKIEATEIKKKTDSYAVIFPGHAFSEEKEKNGQPYVEASLNNQINGYILFAEGKGYSSTLKIAYGLDKENKLVGITILFQQETPGLGARCEEVKTDLTLFSLFKNVFKGKKREAKETPAAWFQVQYQGLALEEVWLKRQNPKGKIEAITGATITSNAITEAVRLSMEKFTKNN